MKQLPTLLIIALPACKGTAGDVMPDEFHVSGFYNEDVESGGTIDRGTLGLNTNQAGWGYSIGLGGTWYLNQITEPYAFEQEWRQLQQSNQRMIDLLQDIRDSTRDQQVAASSEAGPQVPVPIFLPFGAAAAAPETPQEEPDERSMVRKVVDSMSDGAKALVILATSISAIFAVQKTHQHHKNNHDDHDHGDPGSDATA